jgi:hypothetical protein
VTIQPATVLEAVKARPGNIAVRPMPTRRPALTASARAGVRNLRSGQKKAFAVKQKKGQKDESKKERKGLRSWRRLENGRMAPPGAEQKNRLKEDNMPSDQIL